MKISVDDQELYILTDLQKKIIQNDIPSEIFEEDMKRRLRWILLDEKVRKCAERLRKEWEPKLKERGVEMIPLNDEAFAEFVFQQPDYKNRSQRERDG
ncbi:hypothetical protein HC928_02545 [bacterium]|nr:hypothetical protein [bacterium]